VRLRHLQSTVSSWRPGYGCLGNKQARRHCCGAGFVSGTPGKPSATAALNRCSGVGRIIYSYLAFGASSLRWCSVKNMRTPAMCRSRPARGGMRWMRPTGVPGCARPFSFAGTVWRVRTARPGPRAWARCGCSSCVGASADGHATQQGLTKPARVTAQDLGFIGARSPAAKTGRAAPAKRRGRPASAGKPKYRDEAGNVWGGRGPRPAWLRTALARGKVLEEFAVA
jgi:hypothetical protein